MTEQVELSSFDLRYECCRMKSTSAEKILLESVLTHGIRDPLQGVDTKDGIRILLNGFKRVRCAKKLGTRTEALPFLNRPDLLMSLKPFIICVILTLLCFLRKAGHG